MNQHFNMEDYCTAMETYEKSLSDAEALQSLQRTKIESLERKLAQLEEDYLVKDREAKILAKEKEDWRDRYHAKDLQNLRLFQRMDELQTTLKRSEDKVQVLEIQLQEQLQFETSLKQQLESVLFDQDMEEALKFEEI